MKAIVWSKNQCPFCDQAKKLLGSKGIEFTLWQDEVRPFVNHMVLQVHLLLHAVVVLIGNWLLKSCVMRLTCYQIV